MFRSRKSSQTVICTSSLASGSASIIKRPPITEPSLPPQDDLTIESMSAVFAAAVQMFTSKGTQSSLSIGNASILQPSSKRPEKRRFSLITNWLKSPISPCTPALDPPLEEEDDSCSEGSRTSSVSKFDDGRDELCYRGIEIKELKTTLTPLIITDEERFPMPTIKLTRPTFAKINY